MSWIDATFPAAVGRHLVTSEESEEYNCIAYAAGDLNNWWSHQPGYKWPAVRSPLITALVAVFGTLGYERCDSAKAEAGYQKVALYAKNHEWSHAAKQLPSGRWSSKLGPYEDIEHETPECLCGASYGDVYCIMRKSVTDEAAQET